MPRKTDGIEFEIHPRPTKGEDGKPLLYVRPAKGRKKNFKELDDFCTKYRSMRTGELKQAFDVVMEVVGHWVSDGYRVETPLGSFAPKLKLLGEHTDPKTIHGRGNSQMYDAQAMEEALRQSLRVGYTTIPDFMIHSGLKRDSAKSYLNSLCYGEHPRLRRIRESRRYLYFPLKETVKG